MATINQNARYACLAGERDFLCTTPAAKSDRESHLTSLDDALLALHPDALIATDEPYRAGAGS